MKGLHEFLYTHLNIKRFNMFHNREKYRPDYTVILYTPDSYKDQPEGFWRFDPCLPPSLPSSSKLILTRWHLIFTEISSGYAALIFKDWCRISEVWEGTLCTCGRENLFHCCFCKTRHLVHEVCHQNLWAVWDETLSCGRKALFQCFL